MQHGKRVKSGTIYSRRQKNREIVLFFANKLRNGYSKFDSRISAGYFFL